MIELSSNHCAGAGASQSRRLYRFGAILSPMVLLGEHWRDGGDTTRKAQHVRRPKRALTREAHQVASEEPTQRQTISGRKIPKKNCRSISWKGQEWHGTADYSFANPPPQRGTSRERKRKRVSDMTLGKRLAWNYCHAYLMGRQITVCSV